MKTIQNFKILCKAIINKVDVQKQTCNPTIRWNKTEAEEINTHTYNELIYDK